MFIPPRHLLPPFHLSSPAHLFAYLRSYFRSLLAARVHSRALFTFRHLRPPPYWSRALRCDRTIVKDAEGESVSLRTSAHPLILRLDGPPVVQLTTTPSHRLHKTCIHAPRASRFAEDVEQKCRCPDRGHWGGNPLGSQRGAMYISHVVSRAYSYTFDSE